MSFLLIASQRMFTRPFSNCTQPVNAIEVASQPSTPTKTNVANVSDSESYIAEGLLEH